MIASLAMYDMGPVQGANDRLWADIRNRLKAQGIAAPDELTRGEAGYWPAWRSPDLLLSQTCGLPFRSRLHPAVHLVGAFNYELPDAPAGYYFSQFIARADDPRNTLADFADAGFAVNDALSQSGWAAPAHHMAELGLSLRPQLISGGHRASALAVSEGRADYAALDAQTLRMLSQVEPNLVARLKIIAKTAPSPGLPLITAQPGLIARLQRAISDAVDAMAPADRHLLHIAGFVMMPLGRYLAVPTPAAPVLAMP